MLWQFKCIFPILTFFWVGFLYPCIYRHIVPSTYMRIFKTFGTKISCSYLVVWNLLLSFILWLDLAAAWNKRTVLHIQHPKEAIHTRGLFWIWPSMDYSISWGGSFCWNIAYWGEYSMHVIVASQIEYVFTFQISIICGAVTPFFLAHFFISN